MLRLADRYHEELGILPRIAFLGPVDFSVPSIVGDNLLHVFGEALSTVARHANASRVEAVVSIEGEWLSFSLMDDGVGMSNGPRAGNGIRNMTTRAENLGGTFLSCASANPMVSILEWRAPLSTSSAEA